MEDAVHPSTERDDAGKALVCRGGGGCVSLWEEAALHRGLSEGRL